MIFWCFVSRLLYFVFYDLISIISLIRIISIIH